MRRMTSIEATSWIALVIVLVDLVMPIWSGYSNAVFHNSRVKIKSLYKMWKTYYRKSIHIRFPFNLTISIIAFIGFTKANEVLVVISALSISIYSIANMAIFHRIFKRLR